MQLIHLFKQDSCTFEILVRCLKEKLAEVGEFGGWRRWGRWGRRNVNKKGREIHTKTKLINRHVL